MTEASGTFECPICAWPEPHSHTGEEIAERPYIDGARKAFEAEALEFMRRDYFKDARTGYWWGYDAYAARRTETEPGWDAKFHGWAQRDYPSGRYSNEFVEVQWQLWKMAWLASARRNIQRPAVSESE